MTERGDTFDHIPTELPAIAVKNAVIFPIPNLPIPLSVGRARTMEAIERAGKTEGYVVLVTQRDPDAEKPSPEQLFSFGSIARVLRVSQSMEGTHELLLEGVCRARIERFTEDEDVLAVEAYPAPDTVHAGPELDALTRTVRELASNVVRLSPRLPDEAVTVIEGIDDPSHLADLVTSQLHLTIREKQALLEMTDVGERLAAVVDHVAHEASVLEIKASIRTEVRDSLDKHQREVYLREQLRAIQKELGDDDEDDEGANLEERVLKSGMPEASMKAAKRELKRLKRMNPHSAEFTVARTYVDWLLDVPWSTRSDDNLDVRSAAQMLDEDHYGLDKVKRRITEYLAVRKLKGDMKGPILCLVGPPGVGKTSLARSIARALDRKFVRVSLGGVRDEAEIRGHRRTYIGALPGRIVKGLKRAGTMNPVFCLDEIDKLGQDFRGDPASALLEVLDPEQNVAFSDHYIDVDIDLSEILFITTANRMDTIPPALRDRMEVIDIPGYILDEKLQIALRHLLAKQLEEHGLTAEQVVFNEDALMEVIDKYTREAGVRTLTRQIASVLRSVARDVAMEEAELPVTIDAARVRTALGPQRFFPEHKEDVATPGVGVGLAWTPVGGEILFIEAAMMKGTGKLTLTGQLGEVMKESAHAAMSYIHSRAEQLEIPEEMFEKKNFHLHLPSGAIPKDGPSAGVTIVSALTSLMTGRCMRDGLAMTGEMTLRGVVLPVGGVKEKVLAAFRAGIKEIILPKKNEGDLEDIPADLRDAMTFHLVDRIDEVVKLALEPKA